MTQKSVLPDDFGTLLAEVEQLLARAGSLSGDAASEIQADIESRLATARQRLREFETQANEQAQAVRDATQAYVRQNPWQAVGIAAGIGFVAGLLLARR